MSGFSVEIKGIEELIANSHTAQEVILLAAGRGAYRECEHVMGRSKDEFCPVDTGALKSTGKVSEPHIEETSATVEMTFGGPSGVATKDGRDYVGYALYVHEGTVHMSGHKYLERPTMEEAPGMGPRIHGVIQAELSSRF